MEPGGGSRDREGAAENREEGAQKPGGGSIEPGGGGQQRSRGRGAAETQQPPPPHSSVWLHISRGDEPQFNLQHFLSSSGNKTSGAGRVPLSRDTPTKDRDLCFFPGTHTLRGYEFFTVAPPQILEDGFSPGDIGPLSGHRGSSAGRIHRGT